jgi:pentalenic acid synthase
MMADARPAEDMRKFPVGRECPYRPASVYQRLRESAALSKVRLFDGQTAWLVTGYAEARALLADPALSFDRTHANFPALNPELAAVRGRRQQTATLIGVDPPEHTRQRRMLIPWFTVRSIARLRPAMEHLVNTQLDAMLRQQPPVDLVASFALALPSTVICELLGVPYADHEFFEEQSRLRMIPGKGAEALGRLSEYLARLIRAKEKEPGRGLLDELIANGLARGALTGEELVTFALVLLMAGHDTTANLIAMGTLALLEHPDQLAALRADPGLVPGAVEELLRLISLVELLPRIAIADIPVSGEIIRAGDGVLVAAAAANDDPVLLESSGAFDIRRSLRQPHLSFGYGVHQCLGQNLARAELEIAFKALFERIPTLRLAEPVEELSTLMAGGVMPSMRRLLVTW